MLSHRRPRSPVGLPDLAHDVVLEEGVRRTPAPRRHTGRRLPGATADLHLRECVGADLGHGSAVAAARDRAGEERSAPADTTPGCRHRDEPGGLGGSIEVACLEVAVDVDVAAPGDHLPIGGDDSAAVATITRNLGNNPTIVVDIHRRPVDDLDLVAIAHHLGGTGDRGLGLGVRRTADALGLEGRAAAGLGAVVALVGFGPRRSGCHHLDRQPAILVLGSSVGVRGGRGAGIAIGAVAASGAIAIGVAIALLVVRVGVGIEIAAATSSDIPGATSSNTAARAARPAAALGVQRSRGEEQCGTQCRRAPYKSLLHWTLSVLLFCLLLI